MSRWPTVKAKRLLAALSRIGWTIRRQRGSHRVLERGAETTTFAFHDDEEVGGRILSRIAKETGLKPEDL